MNHNDSNPTDPPKDGQPNLTARAAAALKARREREAAALRANLRRRKAQQQARETGPKRGENPAPGPDGSETA